MIRRFGVVLFWACVLLAPATVRGAAIQIVVSQTTIKIPEGGTATLAVHLSDLPLGVVELGIVSTGTGDPDLVPTSGFPMSFSSPDYNIDQYVVFEAREDDDAEDGIQTFRIEKFSGSDTVVSININVIEIDNDEKIDEKLEEQLAAEEAETLSTRQQQQTVNLEVTKSLGTQIVQSFFVQPVAPRGLQPVPAGDAAQTVADPAEDAASLPPLEVPALANIPAGTPTWNLSLTSAARYAHTTYHDFGHASSDRAGLTFNSSHQWDRLSLDVSLPLDITDFDRHLDHLDNIRHGVVLVPRYQLLLQEQHGIDLTVGATAYYLRTWMTGGQQRPNPDHYGGGLMVALRKAIGPVEISAGVLGQRARNLDDVDEITGDRSIDVLNAGINVGVPIGDNWAVNAMATYTHVAEMPKGVDPDTGMAGLGVTYLLADKWSFSLTGMTDLHNEDEKTVEVHFGLGWTF